jgi:hypothetical protein
MRYRKTRKMPQVVSTPALSEEPDFSDSVNMATPKVIISASTYS